MAAKLDKNLLDVKMFVFFIDTLVSVGALQPFTISICHVEFSLRVFYAIPHSFEKMQSNIL